MAGRKRKFLFVCMGNICRSPTAEGVTRSLAQATGLAEFLELDSAGTHDYHIGHPPDQRTQLAAQKRGYDLSTLRARQVVAGDFVHFDRIFAMDRANLDWLQQRCPAELQTRLELFLDLALHFDEDEVPDPYYGGSSGFDRALDLIEDAAHGLIASLRRP